jgi:hypothetical protein
MVRLDGTQSASTARGSFLVRAMGEGEKRMVLIDCGERASSVFSDHGEGAGLGEGKMCASLVL